MVNAGTTQRDNQLALYRAMLTARQIDKVEQELTARGEAFFHVSGAGHEATAALVPHLNADDWLHCHYRDKALMLARGVAPRDFFDALLCNDNSHSRGRQMSAHMSDPRLNLLSIVGPVGNSALQAAGVAAAVKDRESSPIVLCSIGDGTTQQGEFLEACAEAVRSSLPVLFLVEDNRWAISTTTSCKTPYSLPHGEPTEFYGIHIHRIDGRDVVSAQQRLGSIVADMRTSRDPALVVFNVERLANHTNADDQTIYREEIDIQRATESGDPIRLFEQHLLSDGVRQSTLDEIQAELAALVAAAEAEAFRGSEPEPLLTAKLALPSELTRPSLEHRGAGGPPELTMREAMREVLRHQLQNDERVTLFGEDIEDPKGDVFGVTKGLSSEFPTRVKNSPLTESTIVGVAIGRALTGERPVAFLQFADFLPLAYNQIASELGSMHWRTDGQWSAAVIVMIACGGYRPGLGPFHAQTFESIAAHTPGIDVFMPSTATDAAGLLNAAFQSGRPTLLFYPKSCLNDPEQKTSADVQQQFVPIGTARVARVGGDITFVAWGNTVRLCERVATELEQVGIEAEILDLRSLSPWDEHAVLSSAEKTARMVVVHEDNHTCGFGAEVIATVAQRVRVPVAVRRVARPDTYVPCNFANQIEVLPSFKRLLTTAAELLDLELSWIPPEKTNENVAFVDAIGSGPSDETVDVVELMVRAGSVIERGDVVAELEATKSVFNLTSSVSGIVEEVLVAEGDTVAVGAPLLRLSVDVDDRREKPIMQDQPGTPVLSREQVSKSPRSPSPNNRARTFEVGISTIAAVKASRLVTNAELIAQRTERIASRQTPPAAGIIPHPHIVATKATVRAVMADSAAQTTINESSSSALQTPAMTADDIVRRTGIEQRFWVGEGENAINLAVRACWDVLDREELIPNDLDLLLCSTISPTSVTPSVACQVLNVLSSKSPAQVQAYDINAACSGYLYALQAGYDFLQSKPNGRVLIVTAEVLSPLLDLNNFGTAILFADAASASILYGEEHFTRAAGRLTRPELSAKADGGNSLTVPLMNDGYIQMKGNKVFGEAVRSMVTSLNKVCRREGIDMEDLDLIIPHQANQRIIDAIQKRVGVNVFSNIRQYGNTSSSSIPLCLDQQMPTSTKGDRVGLCAFGGGFTFGASLLEIL